MFIFFKVCIQQKSETETQKHQQCCIIMMVSLRASLSHCYKVYTKQG